MTAAAQPAPAFAGIVSMPRAAAFDSPTAARDAGRGRCPAAPMAHLVSIRDGAPHLRFPLGERDVIGRASECEIQILDTELSRRHTELRRGADGRYQAIDLDSRNGTRVNGARIGAPTELADGDELQIGSHRFAFNPPVDIIGDRDGDKALHLVRADVRAPAAAAAPVTLGVPRQLDAGTLRAIHRLAVDALAAALAAPAGQGGDRSAPLALLLRGLAALVGAQRGFVARLDPRAGWRPLVVHADGPAIAISATVLERAVAERRPFLVTDALAEVGFSAARSVLEQRLRAMLVIPLLDGDRLAGVLQLDHRDRLAFTADHLAIAAIAAEAAVPLLRRDRAPAADAPPPPSDEPDSAAAEAEPVFLGADPRLSSLLASVARAAAAGSRVLITGESGTGKELIARRLHAGSPRAAGPWVAVNCAAFGEGLLDSELFGHEPGAFTGAVRRKRGCFELADGGTLFLDEVAELSPATQARLLRALQEGRFYRVGGERPIDVDVRVVAATNRDLRRLVADGAFREDLYFRLAVVPIELPPLRDRGGDLALLTEHFLDRTARALGRRRPHLSPEAWARWQAYRWPGNVRELRNVVERLVVLDEGSLVTPERLPLELQAATAAAPPPPTSMAAAVASLERELVAGAMERSRGNKAAAARALGISRPTLDKKLRDHGLDDAGRGGAG
jgi:transcriptional regulator with GAF, ATPase, and Fis domain